MTDLPSTAPQRVARSKGSSPPVWQDLREPSSFEREVPVYPPRTPIKADPARSANVAMSNGHGPTSETAKTAWEQEPIQPRPVDEQRPVQRLGRRSFRTLYHWEGVVEEVTGDSFSARLVPFERGLPMRAKVEFTEFQLDDLAEESDRALVEAGAVFYWTIGKAKNRAGQLQNASLVRFRRLPSPRINQKQRAHRRARQLLESSPDEP